MKVTSTTMVRRLPCSIPAIICFVTLCIVLIQWFKGTPPTKVQDAVTRKVIKDQVIPTVLTRRECDIGFHDQCKLFEECKQVDTTVTKTGVCACKDGYIRSKFNQCAPVTAAGAFKAAAKVYTYSDGWKVNDTVCKNLDLKMLERTSLKHIKTPLEIFILDPKTDFISSTLKRTKMFDGQDFDVMHHYFANTVDKDTAFIDIGANLGVHTLKMAELGIRSFAVETSYECVQRMCASIQINDLQQRVTIMHNALGADHKEVKFTKTAGNFGFNFIENEHSRKALTNEAGKAFFNKLFTGNSTIVKSTTLDDFVDHPELKGIKSVFIKLDVEGFEHKVIEGSDRFFKNMNVKGLYMEWNKQGGYKTGAYIVEKMLSRGFEAFNCGPFIIKTCALMSERDLKIGVYNILWLPKKSNL